MIGAGGISSCDCRFITDVQIRVLYFKNSRPAYRRRRLFP
ncbi:hypothetical protein D1AOALGA4SA_2926 [Olavius algarvensis Delta 1 endosymbiont]|nr:hypothetical protein D1AOALGA4SA_2926 [Olavius algarvensis Delta 1 endosymbiont]